jgi:leader peptidase (prepilin peptidase)/N-methyltransferase
VVDLRDFRLPDTLTIPLIAGGIAVSGWAAFQPWWWSLFSALVGFSLLAALDLAYRHIRGRAGLGLGDAKLLAASGAWLGAEQLPVVLLWATGSAIVCVLLSLVRGRRVSATDRIPFGPFLAFGTWIAWLHAPH